MCGAKFWWSAGVTRNSYLLIAANIVSKFGTWLSFIAILILVQNSFQQTISLALVIIIKRLPSVLLSYFGGSLADKYGAKIVVIILNVLMFLLTLTLCFLDYSNQGFYTSLIISYMGISILEGMYQPSLQALNARLHSDPKALQKTNTLIKGTSMLTIIIAGILSVVFKSFLSVNAIIFIDAVTYILAIFLFIMTKKKLVEKPVSILKTQVLSLKPFIKKPLIKLFQANIGLAIIFAFTSLIVTKYPFEVYHNFGMGTSLINAVIGLGIMASVFLHQIWPLPIKSAALLFRNRYFSCIALICVSFLGFSHSQNFGIGLTFLFMMMSFYAYLKIMLENVLITETNCTQTGKMFSLYYILEETVISISLLLFSLVLTEWSISYLGQILAVLLSVVFLGFLGVKLLSNKHYFTTEEEV